MILLLHICGYTKRDLPISSIRAVYSASGFFLCVAYLISLYQWVFIAMRVNLYGGKFGMRAFRKRVKKSRLTTTVASSVIFLATLALIVLEVWYPFKQITQAVSMVEICEFSFLLLSFIITGSIIIRNLWVYFEKSYIRQRRSMLAALLLTIASLLAL